MLQCFFVSALLTLLSSCAAISGLYHGAPDYEDQYRFKSEIVEPAPEVWDFPRADDFSRVADLRILPFDALKTTSVQDYLEESSTLAFMIIQRDTIIYEHYFEGFTPEDPMTSFSVAKTFTGALIGIAIGEGLINSVEDPVQKYLPDFPFEDVTINHLLDQTSGLDFRPEFWIYEGRDLQKIFKNLGRRRDPGTDFRYENGNSQVLGLILEKVTGKDLSLYMQEKIWAKIGTQDQARWSTDAKGTVKSYCCLNARAMDFARFGRLMMRDGNWNGEQVVPEGWFAEGSRADTTEGSYIRYKRQMWMENAQHGIFSAAGLYGQYLYIYPPKEILIVRFSRKNIHLHAVWSEVFNNIIDQL